MKLVVTYILEEDIAAHPKYGRFKLKLSANDRKYLTKVSPHRLRNKFEINGEFYTKDVFTVQYLSSWQESNKVSGYRLLK